MLTGMNATTWLIIILVYYFLATLLPMNQLIGKLYPIFGICLIVMCIGVGAGIVFNGNYVLPEMDLSNLHPKI